MVSSYNALELRAPWRPGGGALSVTASGSWALEAYQTLLRGSCEADNTALCDVSNYGYNHLGAGLALAWHFLPRTSLVAGGELVPPHAPRPTRWRWTPPGGAPRAA